MSASGRAVLEVLGRRDDLDLAALDFAVAVADMAGYHPFGHEIMSSSRQPNGRADGAFSRQRGEAAKHRRGSNGRAR
jgi:hypothetical protein